MTDVEIRLLQEKLTFVEQDVATLDEVVRRQADLIDAMRAEIVRLSDGLGVVRTAIAVRRESDDETGAAGGSPP